MTYPTFNNGDVLPASDLNAIGLWRITTISPSPATAIIVNNCFTGDFTNYTVIVTPISVASGSDISLQLRTGAFNAVTNYYLANMFIDNTSISSVGENNTGSWRLMNIGAAGNGTLNSVKFDLYSPALAVNTRYQVNGGAWSGSQIRYRSGVGFHDQALSFDGFTILAASQISCTISIYGYNKS
jgi:hypothetical protein